MNVSFSAECICRWAQNCFFVCTYALIFQTCVAVFVPLVLGGEVKNRVDKKSGIEVSGDIEVGGDSVNNLWGGYFAKALTAVRYALACSGWLVVPARGTARGTVLAANTAFAERYSTTGGCLTIYRALVSDSIVLSLSF